MTNARIMRQELARPSRSASTQPAVRKAARKCSSVPTSTRLTGSPGSPSPVIVKLGTALEDLQAHADCARKDEIRRDRISDADSQDPVQLLVDGPEDENDQPDTENAECQDQQAPQKPYQQSNDGSPRQL
jgi:hypothetical protein